MVLALGGAVNGPVLEMLLGNSYDPRPRSSLLQHARESIAEQVVP